MAQDIRATTAGRLGSLLRGSKGRMLNTRRSLPMQALMELPTVLELDSLNNDEKALVMLFLLTMIREHCQTTRVEKTLQHVTLIEEAHRVMSATPRAANREISADTRAESVGMFSAALSELGAYGEGLIIAEQIPNRLVEDALKSTNIKIIHRLPGEDDRHRVGAAMSMGQEQERYLANLEPGRAALFMRGYDRPTFVDVTDYREQHRLPTRLRDERIVRHMERVRQSWHDRLLPFDGCRFCMKQCQYRDRITTIAYEANAEQRFRQQRWRLDSHQRRGDTAGGWAELVKHYEEVVRGRGIAGDEHAAYCYFVHHWGSEVTQAMADQFRRAARGE
jgi:hypothetical protein